MPAGGVRAGVHRKGAVEPEPVELSQGCRGEGWVRARAAGAQANSYEAFGFYSVAMLIGLTQGGSLEWLNQLAMIFIAIRVVYIACYLGNKAY